VGHLFVASHCICWIAVNSYLADTVLTAIQQIQC